MCLLKKCENRGVSKTNCLTPYKLLPDNSTIQKADPNGDPLLIKLADMFSDSTKMKIYTVFMVIEDTYTGVAHLSELVVTKEEVRFRPMTIKSTLDDVERNTDPA